MKMKTPKFYLTLVAAMCTCAFVQAADLSRSDRHFFEKAAKAGTKEVTVSQAALPRLETSAGRDFAQMMVTDHTKANAELQSLAASKGVVLPTRDEKDAKLAQKWSEKTKDVDEDYFEEMVSDHKDAVDLFEKAAKSDDPDIAAFAQKMLPTLRQHLDTAKAQKKLQ